MLSSLSLGRAIIAGPGGSQKASLGCGGPSPSWSSLLLLLCRRQAGHRTPRPAPDTPHLQDRPAPRVSPWSPAHSWARPGPCHPPPQGNVRRAFSSAPPGTAARCVGVRARAGQGDRTGLEHPFLRLQPVFQEATQPCHPETEVPSSTAAGTPPGTVRSIRPGSKPPVHSPLQSCPRPSVVLSPPAWWHSSRPTELPPLPS